jgi:hypothetical protein
MWKKRFGFTASFALAKFPSIDKFEGILIRIRDSEDTLMRWTEMANLGQNQFTKKTEIFRRSRLMNEPTMFLTYQTTSDIQVLPAHFPIPGFGI